jgi:hypothetical protein
MMMIRTILSILNSFLYSHNLQTVQVCKNPANSKGVNSKTFLLYFVMSVQLLFVQFVSDYIINTVVTTIMSLSQKTKLIKNNINSFQVSDHSILLYNIY